MNIFDMESWTARVLPAPGVEKPGRRGENSGKIAEWEEAEESSGARRDQACGTRAARNRITA